MIICFDLDDTLYPEIKYVRSGFKAIGFFLNEKRIIDESPEQIADSLFQIMNLQGRGKVIDTYLRKLGIYSKTLVKSCVTIYRKHLPDIKLDKDVVSCLEDLNAQFELYLVTDGNLIAQRQKIKALSLERYFKKTIPTHQYGVKCAKPSICVFQKICSWEGVGFSDLVYVGDNPHKDFVNLKKMGTTTIRINQGMFRDQSLSQEFMAQYEISNINEIYQHILPHE